MDLTLTTPTLLFPAVSLLLFACTNRFLPLDLHLSGLEPVRRR